MKGFIGSGNIDTNSRLCMASAVVAHKLAFGADLVPGCYEDLDLADLIVFSGHNAAWTHPVLFRRMEQARARGQRYVVIDPRRSETAVKADAHHFIRPGTDVFLLLAMTQVLFAENLLKPGRLTEFTDGITELGAAVVEFTPEHVSTITGIAPAEIRTLARDLAAAEKGVIYGRVGVSVQEFGGLCLWLINALNLLTGHLDEPGGYMFATPALDILGKPGIYNKYDRYRSRVRQAPEFMGELPVACLAEEMLTPGEGQLRALVTSCGNPVLSTPNGAQLDTALAGLDLTACDLEAITLKLDDLRGAIVSAPQAMQLARFLEVIIK